MLFQICIVRSLCERFFPRRTLIQFREYVKAQKEKNCSERLTMITHCLEFIIKECDRFNFYFLDLVLLSFVHSLFVLVLFVMHSSYSPLFTLGLLAERRAGSSSANSPHNTTLSNVPSSSVSGTADDDHASAFYFTLRTRQRDTVEFRSFLSLDLADSNNRSVAGHKRKPSNMSKSTSWTCTSDATSAHDVS